MVTFEKGQLVLYHPETGGGAIKGRVLYSILPYVVISLLSISGLPLRDRITLTSNLEAWI